MANNISAIICKVFEHLNVKAEDVEVSKQSCKAVWQVLATLEQREAIAIVLIDLAGLSYKETGEVLEVTRERVRQIVLKAYRKLKHPTRAKKLWIYC